MIPERVVTASAQGSALQPLAQADALLAAGDAAQAQRLVLGILQREPENAGALLLAGRIERLAGHYEAALKLLEQAAEIAPELVEAHLELARIFRRARDFEGALDELALALHYDPANAAAHFEIGNVHHKQGKYERAIESFRQAIAADPEHARAHTDLGWVYLRRDRFDEARDTLERAVELDPRSIAAQNNLGFVYVKLEQYERALEVFTRLCSGTSRAMLWPRSNLGNALDHNARFDDADRIYQHILKYEPNNFAARWNRALNLLSRHEFAEGWQEYRYRLQVEDVWHPRLIPFAPWEGEPLEGKSLLISAEQGLGDQIMFASCLAEIASRAARVVLECEHRLAALFQRSLPQIRVIGSRHELIPPWLRAVGEVDYHVPFGSLPGFLRNSLADFPRHEGYLRADPVKQAKWKAWLDALGPGLKVGISWRGGTQSTRRQLRSIALADLLPVLRARGCQFVCLQYGDCAAELEQLSAQHGIRVAYAKEAIADYDETAALCAALDLTVSVCTAVIHLNGALGKPVWVMVPAVPEWRYGRSGERMPWYPSVRLLRQTERNDWMPVFSAVVGGLQQLAAGQKAF